MISSFNRLIESHKLQTIVKDLTLRLILSTERTSVRKLHQFVR